VLNQALAAPVRERHETAVLPINGVRGARVLEAAAVSIGVRRVWSPREPDKVCAHTGATLEVVEPAYPGFEQPVAPLPSHDPRRANPMDTCAC
jgi:hypothetical protein